MLRCVDLLEVKVGRSLLINWKVNGQIWEIKSKSSAEEISELFFKNKDVK